MRSAGVMTFSVCQKLRIFKILRKLTSNYFKSYVIITLLLLFINTFILSLVACYFLQPLSSEN